MLATITNDLDKIAPSFEIQPEQIQIIQTPAEFYQTLKVSSYSLDVSTHTLVFQRTTSRLRDWSEIFPQFISVWVFVIPNLYYVIFCTPFVLEHYTLHISIREFVNRKQADM